MKRKPQPSPTANPDLLVKVARQIGSTLGSVVAKVRAEAEPKPVVRAKRRRAAPAKRKVAARRRATTRKKSAR